MSRLRALSRLAAAGVTVGALGALGWVYVGYPLLSRELARRGVRLGNAGRVPQGDATTEVADGPRVSVLIAAYNEQGAIEDKVRSLQRSHLAPEEMEILVASDGSSDRTVERARAVGGGVRVLELPRGGKTRALNAAAAEARGAILVMTDATTELTPETLPTLLAAFDDPRVGCVAAELEYVAPDGSTVASGTGAYWRYERAIRAWEGAVCSLIGCSGALYAVRAAAHRPIHPELDDDFTMPWEAYDQGWITAQATGATSRETAGADIDADFRMRTRVALRAINALLTRRQYLSVSRYGWFAVQLWSHKVLRYAAPGFLGVAFVGSGVWAVLGGRRSIGTVLFGAQSFAYGLALAGSLGVRLPGARLAYYFCHLNAAAAVAWWRYWNGDRAVTWDTERS